ncbi:sodium-dependent transporter [Sedimenticola hydrogenitrophicus]|uniref:sodium-dependent transporter n=1 Tax=Sedimenticola hydrogenitrophicus TaxID=2967975 RepID=UPI0021A696B5|nr:sodium-dependent transporter [Sedimenticola hydrogenitrophicus]
MSKRISIHGQWSSRLMFILAATGAAIGLGNIWKFPYLAGENGGGAFVLVYLLCLALIGIPIMMAEVLIGRRGRQSPVNTLHSLSVEAGASGSWRLVGWAGMLAGLVILSYYSVIAGWTLAYLMRMLSGTFVRVTAEGSGSIFAQLVTDPERLLAWHTIFMVMTIKVVSRGVTNGLEKAAKILMPMLFFLVLVLVAYATRNGDFAQAFNYLFYTDFSKLTPTGVLTAMGHAFFTLSLGMGAMLVYGSYLPSGVSIAQTSILVGLLDTLVALLGGLATFSIVFANGLAAGEGPGLIFQTLPIAFGQMPGGMFFGALFFLLLVFAAWTSAIVLIEPLVAWLIENREMERIRAAIWTGMVAWLLGIVTILSFSHWSFSFHFGGVLKRHGLFDVLDIVTSSIILPLGGLCMALFAGWVMARDSVVDELGGLAGVGFKLWYFIIRFITPAAMLLIFLRAIGVL